MPLSDGGGNALSQNDGRGLKEDVNNETKAEHATTKAGGKKSDEDVFQMSIGPEEVDHLTGARYIPDLQVDIGGENDSAGGDPTIGLSTSSAKDFIEGGKDYYFPDPTDEGERDRLDFQHQLFKLTLSGELYAAPLQEIEGGIHNVLDIGAGTGIWAIEFATKFPSTTVIGTDLSPPQLKSIPPNCHFTHHDAEQTPWPFPHPFSYIHGRALAICFASHLNVIHSAFTTLAPGGYLELQDCLVPFRSFDTSIGGTKLEQWTQLMMKGSAKFGKDWTRVAKYKQYLEVVGFEDVTEKRFEWPMGTWAKGKGAAETERLKRLGVLYREDLLRALEPFSMVMLGKGLGWGEDEVKGLLGEVKEEIMSDKIHTYVPVRVVYGRKPR